MFKELIQYLFKTIIATLIKNIANAGSQDTSVVATSSHLHFLHNQSMSTRNMWFLHS